MKKGKCFSAVNRGQRKKSDFYQTPYSMTKQLFDHVEFNSKGKVVFLNLLAEIMQLLIYYQTNFLLL